MGKYSRIFFGYVFFFFSWGILSAEQTLPKNSGYINDFANVLSNQDIDYLNKFLKELEDSTNIQIGVAIENTTLGYDVFDRAMFIARGWKIGQEGLNNGILIYISISDRKYQIVAADQTQGKLTDGILGEIGRKVLVPYFKQKDYFNGIREVSYEIAIAMGEEFKGRKKAKTKNSVPKVIFPILFFLLFYLIFIRRGGGGGFSKRGFYTPPIFFGGGGFGNGFGGNSGSGSSGWGGFGGGGGFNGGGAGGSW